MRWLVLIEGVIVGTFITRALRWLFGDMEPPEARCRICGYSGSCDEVAVHARKKRHDTFSTAR